MKIARIAAGLLAGTLTLAGCAGTSAQGEKGTEAQSQLSAVPGFDPATGTIQVGVINPLSGPAAAAGNGLLMGLQVYVDRLNADGGIDGKYKVKLVTADSKYDPQQGIAAYNGMADNVVMIGEVLGTGVVKALLPQAGSDDMLVIPGSDSADWLREPNALPVRPTYEAQIINGLAWAADKGGKGKKFCSLLQDDPLGEAVKAGVDHAIGKLGIKYGDEVRFPTTASDFTPQISQLKSGGCEVVVFGASSSAALPAMSSAVQLGFTPRWVTIGPGFADNLLRSPLVDYISQNWIVAAPGAEWGDTSVPGMSQLVKDFDNYAPQGVDPQPVLNIAGYTYGIAIKQLLEKAVAKGDLSHKALLDISHSGLSLDFKGLSPKFQYAAVDKRQAPSEVAIFTVDRNVTGGLKAVERSYDSAAARAYKFSG